MLQVTARVKNWATEQTHSGLRTRGDTASSPPPAPLLASTEKMGRELCHYRERALPPSAEIWAANCPGEAREWQVRSEQVWCQVCVWVGASFPVSVACFADLGFLVAQVSPRSFLT